MRLGRHSRSYLFKFHCLPSLTHGLPSPAPTNAAGHNTSVSRRAKSVEHGGGPFARLWRTCRGAHHNPRLCARHTARRLPALLGAARKVNVRGRCACPSGGRPRPEALPSGPGEQVRWLELNIVMEPRRCNRSQRRGRARNAFLLLTAACATSCPACRAGWEGVRRRLLVGSGLSG